MQIAPPAYRITERDQSLYSTGTDGFSHVYRTVHAGGEAPTPRRPGVYKRRQALPSPRSRATVFHMKGWLLVAVLISTPVLAFGQSLRCAEKIVSEGMTSHELADLCGEPAQVERKTIYNDISTGTPHVSASSTIEIHVEMWIYNFGPTRLMERVWIQDGVITRIESLGRYGS